MISIVNGISYLHNFYVAAYETVGSVVSFIRERTPRLPAAIAQSTQRVVSVLRDYSYGKIAHVAQRTNRWLRPNSNQSFLKDLRPEAKEMTAAAEKKCDELSQICSAAFRKEFIFSSIPTLEQLDQLEVQLRLLPENEYAQQALIICEELRTIIQEKLAFQETDLSAEDCKALEEELKGNILLRTSFLATLENIGEYLGGALIDESSPILPESLNPAVMTAQQIRNRVASPAGKLLGGALSILGAKYLISKLPLMSLENRRGVIQALLIGLILAAEYLQVNPLSNFIRDSLAQLGYDLSFYSVALLFNYAGMVLGGTTETIGEYVRNMTPSMISYYAALFALESYGAGSFMRNSVALLVSHVAYNFDIYSQALQGKLLEFHCIESVNEQLTSIQKTAIRSSRAQLTALFSNLLLNQLRDALGNADLDQYVPQELIHNIFNVLENVPTLEAWIERLDLQNENLAAASLIIKTANSFFRKLKEPEIQALLENYNRALEAVIENSSIERISEPQQNPQRLKGAELAIIQAFLPEPQLAEILQTQKIDAKDIDSAIDAALAPLSPMLPAPSNKEKAVSKHVTSFLLNLFALFVAAKLAQQDFPEIAEGPLERQQTLLFVENLTDLLLHTRYPQEVKASRRGVLQKLIRSQLT